MDGWLFIGNWFGVYSSDDSQWPFACVVKVSDFLWQLSSVVSDSG